MQAKLDELESQINVCDPTKLVPQLATALYLFETKRNGHSFKKALKDLSPHAYYKIYLEPLFNALTEAGAFNKEHECDEMKDLNARLYNVMMERAGYYYDSGPRCRQKAVLWALQRLMKNDLLFGEAFRFKESQLVINKINGNIEIININTV